MAQGGKMKRINAVLATLGVLVLAAGASAATSKAPTLTYKQAKARAGMFTVTFAAKDATASGDTLKTQPVVGTLFRRSRLAYFAQASWTKTDPDGCSQCGYDEATNTFFDTPTDVSCFIDVTVARSSRRPYATHVTVRDSSCI
jgi:hypothetical protein